MSKVLQTIGLTALELARIVSLPEAAKLSGLSEDTLKRRYADKILQLSTKRKGMRVRDALLLSETQEQVAARFPAKEKKAS